MVENDIILKIREIVSKNGNLEEADVRSIMILMRKLLDQMSQADQQQFLIIRLFANWSVHVEITKSNTGLRIISAINDALVLYKSADTEKLRIGISKEIGFSALRREMKQFLNYYSISDILITNNNVWAVFITHLIEIIRDVPLSFPPIASLNKTEKKIYDQISHNPIKPGAGVIAIQISLVDYGALGAKNAGELMCLQIRTEDTTTTFVPLKIDVSN